MIPAPSPPYGVGMDGFVARRDLMPARRLKALSARSDARGLAQLGLHTGALALTGAAVLASAGTAWSLPATAVHGVVLVFLFSGLHESVHRTAFRSRALNDRVARVAGFLLVLPPDFFRHFHYAHHRHTRDPARDPELAVGAPESLAGYLWLVSGLPYWGERIRTTLKHALTGRVDEPFVPAADRARIVAEARAYLALYALAAAASAASGSDALLRLWIVPALVGQPVLRLYLLAEHTGCPMVREMLDNTRTTLTNAIVRRLAWNMPYHVEHHLFPGVPFHALPAVHREVKERLSVTAPGYAAFHRELVARLTS